MLITATTRLFADWRTKLQVRPLNIIVVLVTLVLTSAFLTWQLSRSRTYQVAGELVARVETAEKVVALTFDDGPSELGLDAVLPLLQERGVKATFFLVGSAVARNPGLAALIAVEEPEIGNHTYSHQRMVLKSSHCSGRFCQTLSADQWQVGRPCAEFAVVRFRVRSDLSRGNAHTGHAWCNAPTSITLPKSPPQS